jgi:membrane protein
MVANAGKADQGALAGVLSLGAIALGASATFTQLTDALNVIWRAPPRSAPLAALIRIRLTSFGLVVGIGFLLVVLLVADAALKAVTRQIVLWGPWLDPVASLLQQTVSFGFLCFAFALLLKILPDVKVHWRNAFTGAVAAALLFTGGKHLFALYLAGAGTANVIGAAGAITAVMMWLYFSGAVFLLGAEVAAHASGSRKPEMEGDKKTEGEDNSGLQTQPALLR